MIMWSRLLVRLVSGTFITVFASLVLCQSQDPLPTGKIDVRVLHAIHEPEETSVSYVTIAVTVRSAGKPFVIPNCSEPADRNSFCFATLRRANGRAVRVRKGLEATLGFEDPSTWKPVRVLVDGEVEFEFSIDMGLLDVRPGQQVRLSFGIWRDEDSMRDSRQAITILTPVFRIPDKPE